MAPYVEEESSLGDTQWKPARLITCDDESVEHQSSVTWQDSSSTDAGSSSGSCTSDRAPGSRQEEALDASEQALSMFTRLSAMYYWDLMAANDRARPRGIKAPDLSCTQQARSKPRRQQARLSKLGVGMKNQATRFVPNPTTVLLRNIPNTYTPTRLIHLLDDHGFENRYDFLYLPFSFDDGQPLGYALVNLVTHEDALRFTVVFQGLAVSKNTSAARIETSWAGPCHGRQALVERYRNSTVMHESLPDHYKPMVFQQGHPVPFPQPTKSVKAPTAYMQRINNVSTQTEAVDNRGVGKLQCGVGALRRQGRT